MVAQDDRLRSTSEILNNIKIIKLQSWEEKFKTWVESLHAEEFKWPAKISLNVKVGGTVAYVSQTSWIQNDPFSAVDAHTAAILLKDCVLNALNKKTVILVTHQVEFVSHVDRILVMEGGVVTQEEFEDVINVLQPLEFHGFHLSEDHNETEQVSMKGQHGLQLTQEEEKEIGDVSWKPFWYYVYLSNGLLLLCLIVLAQVAFIGLQAASTFWLALAIDVQKVINGILIGVYTIVSLISIGFASIRSNMGAHLGLKASASFFFGFNNAIFKAPMVFSDSTSVGRILTRASSDLRTLDFDMPYALIFFQQLTPFAAALLLVLLPKGLVPPGHSESYALSFSGCQIFVSTWFCNLSNYIVSVERINQFIYILEEPPSIAENKKPPLSWPSKINKMGLTMGLKDLKMKLSIIRQESTLFKGRNRTNLDSLGLYSDEEIWKALEKCQLKATVINLPNLLDSSGEFDPET
ncbi:hypothetical protein K1719_019542 [Acacia pycnantha]|nr:hypothetical protein K1719_019542 [Acacia pycnantha]